MKKEKGITLIALVITIIVLLILAAVGIAMLTGENGILSKAISAKEKQGIGEAKEKIELALQDLRIEEESKGETLTKEDLPRINNEDIDVGSTENFPVEVTSDEYVFEIDDKYKVTYSRKVDSTVITYTTEPTGYTNQDNIVVKIKIRNPKGIKEIEYPKEANGGNEGKKETNLNLTEKTIEYTVTQNGTHTFKVIDNENEKVEKDIVIQQIDKLAPKDFTITAEGSETKITVTGNTEDEDEKEGSVKSGIERYEYYVKDANNTETKYETNEITGLKSGTYSVYVKAYDRAGNSKQSNTVEGIKVTNIIRNVTAKQIEENPSVYYGSTVTNYTSQNGQTDWKIFYSNGENIFLITGDYVEKNKIDKTKTKMTTGGTYNAYWSSEPSMQQVTDETKQLFMTTGYNLNSKYENLKCVSTLLNTDNWETFKDSEGKAKSCIGGPTIEMWMTSWNNLYPNDKLYCNKTGSTGYYVGTNSSPTGTEIGMNAKQGYRNKLYYPHTSQVSGGTYCYWIASPSAKDYSAIVVVNTINNITYRGINATYIGVRPVIALESSITVDIEN